MSGKVVARSLWMLLAGAGLASGVGVMTAVSAPDKAAVTVDQTLAIKGTCTFGGRESTWSATLTAKGNGVYDAVYVSTWGGNPLNYVGTIETDGKTKIDGTGKASGGRANGNFEFSGTYDKDGIARCNYKEIGGGRRGTLTAGLPEKGADKAPADVPSAPTAGAR